jgi:hypothetical protein
MPNDFPALISSSVFMMMEGIVAICDWCFVVELNAGVVDTDLGTKARAVLRILAMIPYPTGKATMAQNNDIHWRDLLFIS